MNIITINELYDDLKNNPENIILINVLSKSDFDDCHISGSINIPLAELPSKLHTLDRNKKIIVHCAHEMCTASERGFTKFYPMQISLISMITKEESENGFKVI